MGGFRFFVRLHPRLYIDRRRSLIGDDFLTDLIGVAFAHQPIYRILDKLGVAEIGIAVHIGMAHRLGHGVDRRSRVKAHAFQIVALNDIEDLAQRDATGARWWRRDEFITAIATGDRRSLGHFVVGENRRR
ncbi:Uncharacterised protein [Serratia fonticola]|uniref:Uncharacterized protein n=1 Tax=Serratia fonticola TaxID=47917 RepID=A0A4U9UXA8_SERFO|nr:Uncharacterised protein [Serratia fonticola]